jgi:pantoate--beta-alanine ligase
MEIIESPSGMSRLCEKLKTSGSLGFVPTMGYLHEGHLSLIRAARAENASVVVSIFVNPAQFGPSEDLDRYPRDMDGDLAKCRAQGVDAVFTPGPAQMYPEGFSTYVEVGKALTDRLCGVSRPGHFRGVATVVCKLFNVVRPDRAYFGAKDYQQTVVVKRMASDLDMGVDVVVLPTVREADGLAMSSRNSYLGPDERKAAAAIFASLREAAALKARGVTDSESLLNAVRDAVASRHELDLEYAELVDPDDLSPLGSATGRAVLAVAVRAGATRLIDNILL